MKTFLARFHPGGFKEHWLAAALALVAVCGPARTVTVTIDGSVTYQVIDGFGVNANHRNWTNNELQPVLDALIDQGGMTLFRVVYDPGGWEETNVYNPNPTAMNWNYYQTVYRAPDFQAMWGEMAYLNQRGITNGVMLNFQGVGPAWMGGSALLPGYEDQWAEMVASLLIYARYTNQLQFTLVSPVNEPDIMGQGIDMTAAQYVTALHDLGVRLDANGLSDMRFVGPDLGIPNTNWLVALMSDPYVMSKLAFFGEHSYSPGGSDTVGLYNYLQQSPYPDRRFWMTEYNVWCDSCEFCEGGTNSWEYSRGSVEYLVAHLANGASAGLVWEGYDSFYHIRECWSYWGLFGVDDINAVPKTYTPRATFYAMAQLTKYVRPGARRVDVSGSIDPLDLVAFYHPGSGQVTFTGVNTGTTPTDLSATLTNLPTLAGLDLYYTSSTTNFCWGGTFPVTNGTFTATLPADCVFALTANAGVSVLLTNPPDGATYAAPATLTLQARALTSTGSVSAVEFFSGATKLGEVDAPPYNLTWSNVPPGAYFLTARATNSAGNIGLSPVVHVAVVGPLAQIQVTPTNATVSPYGTQPFTAIAVDALGTRINPQPAMSWSVSGGGTIGSNGLFSAGGAIGGPFTVTASSQTVSGTASVSIIDNLARNGTGYRWFSLATSSDNAPQAPAPGLNDGDLLTDVPLLSGGTDNPNTYEAAGIVWSSPQTIGRVIYINGSYDSQDNGVFSADFKLQLSADGAAWSDAGNQWTVAPPYAYDSPASANVAFTFGGGVAAVQGVRCLGRVNVGSATTNSWVAFATEVQAFSPSLPPRLSAGTGPSGILISWPGAAANYALESAATVGPGSQWTPVTNTPQPNSSGWTVTIQPGGRQQFYRLHQH